MFHDFLVFLVDYDSIDVADSIDVVYDSIDVDDSIDVCIAGSFC